MCKKFAWTAQEIKQGFTIEQKLSKMCYDYRRWDALFGTRQNVNPSYVMSSTHNDDDEFDDDFFIIDHGRAEDGDDEETPLLVWAL